MILCVEAVNSAAAPTIAKASFIFLAKQPMINNIDKLMSPRIAAPAILLFLLVVRGSLTSYTMDIHRPTLVASMKKQKSGKPHFPINHMKRNEKTRAIPAE